MYEDLETGMLLWVEITRNCPPSVQLLNPGQVPEFGPQEEGWMNDEWDFVQCTDALGHQNPAVHLTRDTTDIVYRSNAVTRFINRFIVSQGVSLTISHASSVDDSHRLLLTEQHFDYPERLLAIEKELGQHFYLIYKVEEI